MSEWKEYKISDLADIKNEKRKPLNKIERESRKGTYPYYGASGIIDYVKDYIFEGEHLLISEDGENLRTRNTPIAFRANGKFWVNNHSHVLKGKNETATKLLEYFFKGFDLNSYITGAVQPKLNKENLLKIPIYLPTSFAEQKAIAEVLSSLDDKIDLLHRQNKTLEAMAEALFRKWIVEEADESWEEGSILELIDLVGGGTPKTEISEYWDGDIPWLSGGDITNNHKSFAIDSGKSISRVGLENSSAKLLPENSLVISARGTVGKFCILSKPMAFSQSNYGIIPKGSENYFFTYLLINFAIEELKSSAYGSVFDTITSSTFRDLKLLLPSTFAITSFENSITDYFSRMKVNCFQIQTLEKLRDTLLPKLMSGEVRVKL